MRAMLSLRRKAIPRAVMTVMAVERDFVSGGTFVRVERHEEDCDIDVVAGFPVYVVGDVCFSV